MLLRYILIYQIDLLMTCPLERFHLVRETFTNRNEHEDWKKYFKPEQIIPLLREAEIELAGSMTTGEVCRALVSTPSLQKRRGLHSLLQLRGAERH